MLDIEVYSAIVEQESSSGALLSGAWMVVFQKVLLGVTSRLLIVHEA